MSDEVAISFPLDENGFLRRQCPTCERDLKWLQTEGEDSTPTPEGGPYCPYCAVQGPVDAWWTPDQLETIRATLMNEVVSPMLDDFARTASRKFGGSATKPRRETEDVGDLEFDVNDMNRIDFDCHPDEPVKVLAEWTKPVHCLMCGTPADQ